jgi:thiol-disulfide isomerase/thioredoxin
MDIAIRGTALVFAALLALDAHAGPARTAASPTPTAARVREALARRPLKTLEGGTLSFDKLSGNVIVVHFWATWCRPCQKELPALDALNSELAAQGGRVLAIAIDSDVANVRRFAREHGLTLPIIADGPAGLARQIDLNAVPFTVVLDREGDIALATAGSGDDAMKLLSRTAHQLVADQPYVSTTQAGGR